MPEASFRASTVQDELRIFIPIFGEVRHFPENGDKKSLTHEINLLADDTAHLGSCSPTSCRGPCARHGKEQQVVSTAPKATGPSVAALCPALGGTT